MPVTPFTPVRIFNPDTKCLTLNQASEYVKSGLNNSHVPAPSKGPDQPQHMFYVAIEHAASCDQCAERIRRLKKAFRPQPVCEDVS